MINEWLLVLVVKFKEYVALLRFCSSFFAKIRIVRCESSLGVD